MSIDAILSQLLTHKALTAEQIREAISAIMRGEVSDIQITAFLVAMRMKGESAEDIATAATVMRELAQTVPLNNDAAVDIVGTGGDGANTFNISTVASFVAAAAGVTIAKHGNRSVSSKSGSADLLEAAGANLQLDANQVVECVESCGIGFMFAPNYHPAMQHAKLVRKALGVRTFFNLLGPLTNPAGVKRFVIGVYDDEWLLPIAKVMQKLGADYALIVHSMDGLDEISIAAHTHCAELKDDRITQFTIKPENYGMNYDNLATLSVDDAKHSLDFANQVFNGEHGPARDIVLINAAAAIMAANLAPSLSEAIVLAKHAIDSGDAGRGFQQFISFTQQVAV